MTGAHRTTQVGGEQVRAFIPYPLPPQNPPLVLDQRLAALLVDATASLRQLAVTDNLVPSAEWFLYGFVRKEAVITSQIEGTQATLKDVLTFEATHQTDRPDDVREICNYVDALNYARREIARPKGLPLSARLLCEVFLRRRMPCLRRWRPWTDGFMPTIRCRPCCVRVWHTCSSRPFIHSWTAMAASAVC
jgi:hypothetical protein